MRLTQQSVSRLKVLLRRMRGELEEGRAAAKGKRGQGNRSPFRRLASCAAVAASGQPEAEHVPGERTSNTARKYLTKGVFTQ